MAIIFTESPDVNLLLNSFNNNVLVFKDFGVKTASKCVIVFTSGALTSSFEITPIDNSFTFNLKELSSYVADYNNFKDQSALALGLQLEEDYNFEIALDFTIYFTDTTSSNTALTYRFIRSVSQINEVINKQTSELNILTNNNLTFFKGFPFDIPLNKGISLLVVNSSNTKSIYYGIGVFNGARLFLSNGLIVDSFKARVGDLPGGFLVENNCFTFDDVGFLEVGHNALILSSEEAIVNVNAKLIDNCKGVYLKWINEYGTWSYWLFNEIYTSTIKTKTIGSFNVDFKDIQKTRGNQLIKGKLAENTLNLNYKSLSIDEVAQLESILTSPRVELWTGNYEEVVSDWSEYWQSVEVVDGSFTWTNTKRDLANVKIQIRKNKYTQN